jgi:Gamma-glutamyl cyclotransferase, AIG2-like
MFDAVWLAVVCGQYKHHRAVLTGYSRHSVRGELYPALVSSNKPGAFVEGRLYRDVSPDDLRRLDAFEGGEYRRIDCEVTTFAATSLDVLSAQVYLFLKPELLLPQDWDVAQFAVTGIEPFLASYAPKP